MSDYKCECGNTSDFFIEYKLPQCGLYCGECGKWIKWLNKDEERLFNHKQSNTKHDARVKAETIDKIEQKLRIWDNKANAIPDYVWHCLNVMKEQNND